MLSKTDLDDAFRGIPAELREGAQRALLEFADAIMALDEKWGELGSEARVTWLNATQLSFLDSPWKLSRAILSVGSIVDFLDNWSDCATSGKWHEYRTAQSDAGEDEDWDPIRKANVAGEKARMALHAIVDRFRSAVAGAPRTVLIELPESFANQVVEMDQGAVSGPWWFDRNDGNVSTVTGAKVCKVVIPECGFPIAMARTVVTSIAVQVRHLRGGLRLESKVAELTKDDDAPPTERPTA